MVSLEVSLYNDSSGTQGDAANACLIPRSVPFVIHPDLLHPGQRTAPHHRFGDDPLVSTIPSIPIHALPFLISSGASGEELSLEGSLENLRMLLVQLIGMGNGGKDSSNCVDGDEEAAEAEQDSLKKETRKKVDLRRFLRLLLDFSPGTAWTAAATGGLSSDMLYDFCCTDEDSEGKESNLKKFLNRTRLDALLQERSQDRKQQIIDAAWMGYQKESFDNINSKGSTQPLMQSSVVEALSSLADSINEMKHVISYAVTQFSQRWQDHLNKYSHPKSPNVQDEVSVSDNDVGDKCTLPYFEEMLLDFMDNDPNFLAVHQLAWDTTTERDLSHISLILTLHGEETISEGSYSQFGAIDLLPVRAFTECLWGMLQPLCIGAILKMKPLMWRSDTTLVTRSEYDHNHSLNYELEVATKGALRSVAVMLQSSSSTDVDDTSAINFSNVYGIGLPSHFKNLLRCIGTLIPTVQNDSSSTYRVSHVMLADGASLSTRLLGNFGTASYKVNSLLGRESNIGRRIVGSLKARSKDGNREHFTPHQGLDDSNWEACLQLRTCVHLERDVAQYQMNIQGSPMKGSILDYRAIDTLDWRFCCAGLYQYSKTCLSLWSNQAGCPTRLSIRSEPQCLGIKHRFRKSDLANDSDHQDDGVIEETLDTKTADRGGKVAVEKRDRDVNSAKAQATPLAPDGVIVSTDDSEGSQSQRKKIRLDPTYSPVLHSRADGTSMEYNKKYVQHLSRSSPNRPGPSHHSILPNSQSGTSSISGGILGSILPTLSSRNKLDCVLGVMTKKAGLLGDQPQTPPLLSLFTTPRIIGKPGGVTRAPLVNSRGRGVLDAVEISPKNNENSSLRHSALLPSTGLGSNPSEFNNILNKDFSSSSVISDMQRKYLNKTLPKLLQISHSGCIQGYMKDKDNDALIGKLGAPSRFSSAPAYRGTDEASAAAFVMTSRLEDALSKVCCCLCRKLPLQTPLSYIDISHPSSVNDTSHYPAVLSNSDILGSGRGLTQLSDIRNSVIDSLYQSASTFNSKPQLILGGSPEDKFSQSLPSISLLQPSTASVLGISPSPITITKQPAVFSEAPVSRPVLKREGAVGTSHATGSKKDHVSGYMAPMASNPHWELIVNTFNQVILSDLHPMIFKCCGSLQCGACCSLIKCAVCGESQLLDRKVKKEIMSLWKKENTKNEKEEPIKAKKGIPSLMTMCRMDAEALFAYFKDRKSTYFSERRTESKKIAGKQSKEQGVLGGAPTTIAEDENVAQTMAFNDILDGLNAIKKLHRTRLSNNEGDVRQSSTFPLYFPTLFVGLLFFGPTIGVLNRSMTESKTTLTETPLLHLRPASRREYSKQLLIVVEEAIPLIALQQEGDDAYRAV